MLISYRRVPTSIRLLMMILFFEYMTVKVKSVIEAGAIVGGKKQSP